MTHSREQKNSTNQVISSLIKSKNTHKSKDHLLSPDQEAKRLRSVASSRRYRKKRKQKLLDLEKSKLELQRKNAKLETQILNLQKQNAALQMEVESLKLEKIHTAGSIRPIFQPSQGARQGGLFSFSLDDNLASQAGYSDVPLDLSKFPFI